MSPNHITTKFRAFLLEKIRNDWLAIQLDARPKTIWISEHEAIDGFCSPCTSPLVAGWYFDGHRIYERDSSEVLAFLNLAAGYPNSTGKFEIGVASFARLVNSEDVALCWQFGGLHGMGYQCSKIDGVYFSNEVWRS